jgi:DNA-binding MarR family transcriptional regulator
LALLRAACQRSYDIVQSEIVENAQLPPASSEGSALLALQRATHATLQILAAELVDLDLTPSEINALANLADGRGRTISELGVAAGSRPTTLTSVLDRLERRGHITRGTRPRDRRVVVIELTPSGRLVAETIRQTLTDLEERALGNLSAEAVAGFHAVLRALAEVPA